jgi:hypothetical protein
MKTRVVLGLLFALLTDVQLPSAAGDGPEVKSPEHNLKLGKIPDVKLAPRPVVGEAQVKRIKELIADLANLERADIGVSVTLSGRDFAPVPTHARSRTLTEHQVKRSQTFRDLVALGPDALPYLLDALDDETPTKITIEHGGPKGGMWYGDELDLNPVNPADAAVYQARVEARKVLRFPGERDFPLKTYTIKLGDVCFVAIGQSVGRGYTAVRPHPTACITVNSPTHDAKLCAEVRAVWTGKDPAKKLWDALLADHATEGISNGRLLNGWSAGIIDRQCEAALRLLFYFPEDSAPLIVRRLEKLDVGKGDEERRSNANGVRAESFISAISWCKEPSVRSALVALFQRAENADDLIAAMSAVEDAEAILARLKEMIEKLPVKENEWGEGYKLLIALGKRAPDAAKPVFQGYLRGDNRQRRRSVCEALGKLKVSWDTELLAPLLEDQRESVGTYYVALGGGIVESGPQRPVRICDAAADTLSRNHPELKFTLRGQQADLDKQIAAIREQLKRK